MYDILIKNATIIDGTGVPGYGGDVAVKDGKIAGIGTNLTGAKTVIDATGLTVTPGWIDSHSHSDSSIISHPDQQEKVEQGITFSITGQCGGSAAPKMEDGKLLTAQDFFEKAAQVPQGSGSMMLVGHSNLRRIVMGTANRSATPEELAKMEQLLAESMEAGCIGMSMGLIYVPSIYATTEELVALAKVVKRYNGVLAAHIRGEGDVVEDSVAEFISIVEAAGCRGVISHFKATGKKNWHKLDENLARIDAANARGADIYLDVYPYIASHTSLSATFYPKQFHGDGTVPASQRLKDPALRQEVTAWCRSRWGDDLSWVLLTNCEKRKDLIGKTVAEAAALDGKDVYEEMWDLICDGYATGCFFSQSEEKVKVALAHPRAMVCTDSGVAKGRTHYHPRLRGTFPRVLGKYVREEQITDLPEMIRKMTSLPAYVYGLPTKGRIAVGMDADLCIFDAAAVTDGADFVHCTVPNRGLCYVLIDGKVVLEQNRYNGTRAAAVIAKKS